ncbi:alpha-glucuronidase family glycosyl hydrolase [Paenibacillus sp. GXUN7292]|uniref:alpha-glucuronidase family glycosyl hydrolase n=1 Tax=Paenibacillus sp. GXUN7292 TaxID=3422499 RepID=UPI003D7CBE38
MNSKGYQAWLSYDQGKQTEAMAPYLKQIVVVGEQTAVAQTAKEELTQGIAGLTGKAPAVMEKAGNHAAIVVGVVGQLAQYEQLFVTAELAAMGEEAFFIRESVENNTIVIAGLSDRGLLYGVFHFLRLLQAGEINQPIAIAEKPYFQLRMINHWDNMDGSIERGYSGRSIFYDQYQILANSPRIKDYARMMASIGINSIVINNVNVFLQETKLITAHYLPDVAKIAAVFRGYGIKLFLSINFAGPYELGELETADPLDEQVQQWWKDRAAEVYSYIPDFGGFLVKADSENRPGPFTYGRDHADGANMLADALAPYGGIVLWRCFVYNCHQDWRDRSTDRARAAYDHFKPLDGEFRSNVILQIKNGPMDFQVREPVSPLFGAMEKTNQMMEFQITQEYTGQQRHVCYLIPQWKEALEYDTYLQGEGTTIKKIAAGQVYAYTHSGIAAVTSIGNDDNWTGHHLAQANLYGYGRLLWNPELSAERIAKEWTYQTFGPEEQAVDIIVGWLMGSWRTYENYTSPLGVGWMVTPHYHYGPDIDGYEYSKWGTYHFADRDGIGVDRTEATGTGYAAQYAQQHAEIYEDVSACPDDLLLFFHHVPYTHKLHSGKTVIQHIYDTHFLGVEQVEEQINNWKKLEGVIDKDRYEHVLGRAEIQLESAKHWRDVVNTYFFRKSGIADEQGRTIY